ncbi:MAG: glycosyl hydrolase family 18, partial [Moorella sp. (in: Bacteria)]|nr:glycosyl hydrolase family 18 [Moorella sp. (in: firmicutes)]
PNLIATYNARPQWSNTFSVPYLFYYKDGVRHEVWYENAASLRLKLEMVHRYGLKGIGVWRLGYEENTFWQVVAEKMTG